MLQVLLVVSGLRLDALDARAKAVLGPKGVGYAADYVISAKWTGACA